jgi:secreted trypsin-like serine protease
MASARSSREEDCLVKRASTLALGLAVSLAVAGASVSSAITDGELDGNDHPFVGLMVAKDGGGDPLWRCSGTLIAPTVFLTAGHCTEPPAVRAEIWFDADLTDAAAHDYPDQGDASGTTITHPRYDPDAFYLYDVGVVVLDEPYASAEYGELPTLDLLDDLPTKKSKTTFTSVGYGLQKSFPTAAAWKNQAQRIRMVAHPRLIQVNQGIAGDFSLLLSNNAHTGGTCFGDSGGPDFLGDSLVIAGVTSYGRNSTCAGTGGVYRIDRADDLEFLEGILEDQD